MFFKHVNWKCGFTAGIKWSKPVGARASPRRKNTKYWKALTAKGTHTVVLTDPIPNTAHTVHTEIL